MTQALIAVGLMVIVVWLLFRRGKRQVDKIEEQFLALPHEAVMATYKSTATRPRSNIK